VPQIRLFLSAVSAEFCSYRDALRRNLDRPNVTVKIQEDFIATGSETLDKLDEYIRQCDAVIHLVGDMTGALAQAPSLQLIRARYPDLAQRLHPLKPCLEPDGPALSYTQWEAWLALYHAKALIVAVPEALAPRAERYLFQAEQQRQQQQHLARLAEYGRYPEISFANADRLTIEILRSTLHDLLARAGVLHKPANLPAASLGELFKGRNTALEQLSRCLGPVPDTAHNPSCALVLSGLGGVGKTRLALEYAWRQADNYAASLFLGADSPEVLQRNLAALCRTSLLDLPEQTDTDEARQRAAVLAWLRQHPGWLLIIDNADTETAAEAVEALLPQLSGGHLLITSRLSNWSGNLTVMQLDTLARADAAEFLLARTAHKRRKRDDDSAQAETLADELGGLALALEQAGAYIAQRRLSLTSYLNEWRGRREQVLAWYDPRLMQYPCSVAVTWQTSFAQLGAPARHLLERLAWLSPAPIPESLLEVPIPDVETETAPFTALAELEAYSLISREQDRPSFSVHRLVQDVTRRQQSNAKNSRLPEALRWLNDAFVGDPQDVRHWPVLEPLLPHSSAVASRADKRGIGEPTNRLLEAVGTMFYAKSLYAEAEQLVSRALNINEEINFGTAHPIVANSLNNLAAILMVTSRLTEAEFLIRRALDIDKSYFGSNHPRIAIDINNLAQILQATDRFAEAEPLMLQALFIDEAEFGPNHPRVAINLHNLAHLFQATDRNAEAELLMRRALNINNLHFGPKHPTFAVSINSLATFLQRMGRLTEAEPLFRQALKIDESYFDANHPNVARGLSNLACLLKDTQQLTEAEQLMRQALRIYEAKFGKHDPNIAICLNGLAKILVDAGDLSQAEHLLIRALKIDESSYGPNHSKVATRLNNLAQLFHDTKRFEAAESLMRRALNIDESRFGVQNTTVARDLNNLGHLLIDTGRYTEAEPFMRRALKIFNQQLGIEHQDSLNVGANYRNLLSKLGKTQDEIRTILIEVFFILR